MNYMPHCGDTLNGWVSLTTEDFAILLIRYATYGSVPSIPKLSDIKGVSIQKGRFKIALQMNALYGLK